MTKVKICGVNDEAALAAATEAGADWVGFVFFPPSPRYVTPARAAEIAATQPASPDRVGLFVEPDEAEIEAALAAVPLAALQIYADAERAAALRARFGLPVWRAVSVERRADLPVSGKGVDRFLLDAKPQPGAVLPGGNALRFDWSLPRGWAAPLPWLLAGGLTPDNVREAVERSGATAVDVSSGVELQRGTKDPALIHAFIAAARHVV